MFHVHPLPEHGLPLWGKFGLSLLGYLALVMLAYPLVSFCRHTFCSASFSTGERRCSLALR